MPPESSTQLWLIRHGETEWSLNGKHTSRTDLPLTAHGRQRAVELRDYLAGTKFAAVFRSPMGRARETCEIAGFSGSAQKRAELMEWDYGDWEGLTTAQIHDQRPGWDLWRDGCPDGEDAAAVGARADRVLATVPDAGTVLVFSHGHFLRVLIARWLALAPAEGALFVLAPGAIGVLAHEREHRVLESLG